jgi:hypothetical protein
MFSTLVSTYVTGAALILLAGSVLGMVEPDFFKGLLLMAIFWPVILLKAIIP